METKRIYIKDTEHVRDEELLEAAEIIRRGGLVAFPTETVYGLGGNALDEDAAKKIYAAKGRPSDNPLIAHVSCPEEVEPLVEYMPEAGKKLMEAFWPGPLTMIFPKSSRGSLWNHRRFGDSCGADAFRSGGEPIDCSGRSSHCRSQRQYLRSSQSHYSRSCMAGYERKN